VTKCLTPPTGNSSRLRVPSFTVVGVQYRMESVKVALSRYVKGDKACWLVPEPDNEHDPNAIKVVVCGRHVGYVPRDTLTFADCDRDWMVRRFTLDCLGTVRIVVEC
jgi:HIRAN domain